MLSFFSGLKEKKNIGDQSEEKNKVFFPPKAVVQCNSNNSHTKISTLISTHIKKTWKKSFSLVNKSLIMSVCTQLIHQGFINATFSVFLPPFLLFPLHEFTMAHDGSSSLIGCLIQPSPVWVCHSVVDSSLLKWTKKYMAQTYTHTYIFLCTFTRSHVCTHTDTEIHAHTSHISLCSAGLPQGLVRVV